MPSAYSVGSRHWGGSVAKSVPNIFGLAGLRKASAATVPGQSVSLGRREGTQETLGGVGGGDPSLK